MNQHLILRESNSKEFANLAEDAKEDLNIRMADLEKGLLSMITGKLNNKV